jgi:hypothetical protein
MKIKFILVKILKDYKINFDKIKIYYFNNHKPQLMKTKIKIKIKIKIIIKTKIKTII